MRKLLTALFLVVAAPELARAQCECLGGLSGPDPRHWHDGGAHWRLAGILAPQCALGFVLHREGVDNAFSGQPNQRANQVLDDPFAPNRTFSQWLNPAAFQTPASGTYGTMPIDAIQGPGRWNIDLGLSRSVADVLKRHTTRPTVSSRWRTRLRRPSV